MNMESSVFSKPLKQHWRAWLKSNFRSLLGRLNGLVQLIRDLSVPVWVIEHDGLRVAFFGNEAVDVDLHQRIFAGRSDIPAPRHIPLWKLKGVEAEMGRDCDLLFACLHPLLGSRLLNKQAFALPREVNAILQLPADQQALIKQILNRETRKDINKITKSGLTPAISEARDSASTFYRDYYLPYVQSRHQDKVRSCSSAKFKRYCAESELLQIRREGELIAGVVNQRFGRGYRTLFGGVHGGDTGLMREGALAAIYYFSIVRAMETACEYVAFGNSRAFLDNGILLFKKKWGATILADEHGRRRRYMGITDIHNPGVRQFLELHPPLAIDGEAVCGLVFVGELAPQTPEKFVPWLRYHTFSGISRFIIMLISEKWSQQKEELQKQCDKVRVPVEIYDLSQCKSILPDHVGL